jgi:outer membrane protein OmpA-like peptidoglycan-associated protein
LKPSQLFIILGLFCGIFISNTLLGQPDYKFGITHRFIVNDFGKQLNDVAENKSSFSDLPRGMEINLSHYLSKFIHINNAFRTGFANYQNDTTNSSFWGNDILFSYTPMFKNFQPYVSIGTGIQKGNNNIDWGIPFNFGINIKIDKAFYANFQVNHRASFESLRSSWHYGVGITFRMKEVKPKLLKSSIQPINEDSNNIRLPILTDVVNIQLPPNMALQKIANYNKILIDSSKNTVMSDMLKQKVLAYKELQIQNITFEINKNQLGSQGYAILDSIVNYLNFYPMAYLSIEGHTDNIGSNAFNKSLSLTRSNVCMNYLVSKGILPNRLFIIGFGEEKPIFDNSSILGRQKNRRVEFISFERH